jgi:hypothetical protein
MVMTLQKLVHLHDHEGNEYDMDDKDSVGRSPNQRHGRFSRAVHNMFAKSARKSEYGDKQWKASTASAIAPQNGFVTGHIDGLPTAPIQKLRTLQRYHGGANQERVAYMEAHSPLTARGFAVSAEQVSIFLTAGKSLASILLPSLIQQTTLSYLSSNPPPMMSSYLSSIVWLPPTLF